MNAKLRRRAKARKRKMLRRIDKSNWSGASPMITPESIKDELANKQQAIAAGGIGTLLELTKRLDLRKEINKAIPLFKIHLPHKRNASDQPEIRMFVPSTRIYALQQ